MIIKNPKGEQVTLEADQEEDYVLLTRKSDKSPANQKRKVKVFIINEEKFEAFQEAEISVDTEKNVLGDLYYRLLHSINLFNTK